MNSPVLLRGSTWDHARGYAPLVATAQRFQQQHPHINIVWEKRSLKAFEDYPVERLAQEYDLVVLDHPCVSRVAGSGHLLPLDENLPGEFLADQLKNTVGASHASYQFAGRQWALAIDAAAPTAFWREDLLAANGAAVPGSWPELLALAAAGHVEVPAAPIYCLMNFYTLCLAAGGSMFESEDHVTSAAAGQTALARLRELLELCDPECFSRNPISSQDLVASAGNIKRWYCPLAYNYSNYARRGYADRPLKFGDAPTWDGQPLRTTLGGAGLAISATTTHRAEAIAYAQYIASAEIQRTLYTHEGGQPGHRSAWLDPKNNILTGDFFLRTLPVLDRAYVRPRFSGYIEFQDEGAVLVHAALRRQLDDREALKQLDELYRRTAGSAAFSP